MPQVEALFDVRIIDTDTQSYSKHSPREVIKSAEKDRKDKYVEACEARRSVFTPLVVRLMECSERKRKFLSRDLVKGWLTNGTRVIVM